MILQSSFKNFRKGSFAGLISIIIFLFYLLFSAYIAPKLGGTGRTCLGDSYFFGFGFLLYTLLKGVSGPKPLYKYLNIFFILGAIFTLELSAIVIKYFIKNIFINLNIGIAAIFTIILVIILINFSTNKILDRLTNNQPQIH